MSKQPRSRLKRPSGSAGDNTNYKKKRFTNFCDNIPSKNTPNQNKNIVRDHSLNNVSLRSIQFLTDNGDEDIEDYKKRVMELEEINSKNFDPKMAFSYDFVTKIHCFLKCSEGKLDFNLVGDTLDAATKIYISKVDIVRKQTQKISTRLSITDGKKEKSDEQQKQRKKKFANLEEYTGRNLVKNDSSINGKIQKGIRKDPLLTNLSSAYDVSDVSMLMNRQLFITPSGRFAFDSTDNLSFSDNHFDCYNSGVQSFPYPIQKDTDIFTVHPALRDFDFTDRSVDLDQIITTYRNRLNETTLVNFDDVEEFDDSLKVATQVYDFCDDPITEDSSVINKSVETPSFNIDDNAEEFDNYADLNVNDDDCEQTPINEIIQELANDPKNSLDSGDASNAESSNRNSYYASKKPSNSGLLDQAIYMTQIFNHKHFFHKNFLKRIHSRRFPNDRSNALFDDGNANDKKQDSTTPKRASRKEKEKPICEPIELRFVEEKPLSNSLRKELSAVVLKNSVSRQDAFRVRQKSGFCPIDFSRSFWAPGVFFKKKTFVPEDPPADQTDNFSDSPPNLDDFDYGDVTSPQEQSGLNLTFDQTLTQDTRQRLISQETSTSMLKMPRYVTDFGEDLDPFGLGEQNREFFPKEPGNDEPTPFEDRHLEYSTAMKKINIKKLKKIMFNFVEKYSWKHDKFQQYFKEFNTFPTECLSFYRLIYLIIYLGDLDERTLEDLTVPIFFVATLHLCNDKKLQLTKFNDNSGNFFITMLE